MPAIFPSRRIAYSSVSLSLAHHLYTAFIALSVSHSFLIYTREPVCTHDPPYTYIQCVLSRSLSQALPYLGAICNFKTYKPFSTRSACGVISRIFIIHPLAAVCTFFQLEFVPNPALPFHSLRPFCFYCLGPNRTETTYTMENDLGHRMTALWAKMYQFEKKKKMALTSSHK